MNKLTGNNSNNFSELLQTVCNNEIDLKSFSLSAKIYDSPDKKSVLQNFTLNF